MQLLDITQLADVNYSDFKEKIVLRTRAVIQQSPQNSRLKRELAACDRLFKILQNDTNDIRNNIRIVHQRSQPLVLLSDAVLSGADAGFTPALNTKVAIVGGRNSSDPAAIRLLPFLQERVGSADAITPLGELERHRIIFVQEKGGFSLRCISGMKDLQKSYQDWKGQAIEARRAKIQGESKDPPIPVHIHKEPPFWDVFPENPDVFRLVVQARAFGVLRLEENRNTKENVIRYTRETVLGTENVDIASSWEEVVQVLEVLACRPDKEEIQRQVSEKLKADQPEAKQALYTQLVAYLKQRETELEKNGGEDSPNYKREATIIQTVITANKLKMGDNTESVASPEHQKLSVQKSESNSERTAEQVFCTKCGTQNPVQSNFCFQCGNQLVKSPQ